MKTGNGKGVGVSDIKAGPFKLDFVQCTGKDVKQTTEGKTVSAVDEIGFKGGAAGFKVGLDRTTTQEDGKPPQTEITPGFSMGKFEGSNAEVGVGVGGCFVLCGQIEVGVQADKVVGDIGNAFSNYVTSQIKASDFDHSGGDAPDR